MFPAPSNTVNNLGELIYATVWLCGGFAIGLAIVVGVCLGLFHGAMLLWELLTDWHDTRMRELQRKAAHEFAIKSKATPLDVEEEWRRRNGDWS